MGCHTSSTALHISSANSGSVPVKLSGEYSNLKSPGVFSLYSFNSFAPSTAISMISFLGFLNTCSLCATEVELYRWTTACFAPASASNVFFMMCSLDCVSTWIVTSSGIRSCSISARQNSYSVSDAAGKPISISLKPISTSTLKNSSFSSRFIGTISAWLPSRRSTLHHMGALSIYSFFVHSRHCVGGIKYPLEYLFVFIVPFINDVLSLFGFSDAGIKKQCKYTKPRLCKETG